MNAYEEALVHARLIGEELWMVVDAPHGHRLSLLGLLRKHIGDLTDAIELVIEQEQARHELAMAGDWKRRFSR